MGTSPHWRSNSQMASYEGYCVKCREKRQFEGQEVELANGRKAAQGTCPVCGTKMNRMLGKNASCPLPSQPSRDLVALPNPHPGRDYEVRCETPEFTCVCPMTGQPDFATVTIAYTPGEAI